MAGWHKLDLGDAILAQAELQRIGEQVLRDRALREGSTAVYVRHDTVASLHCHVTVFFGPDTGELARRLGATPCAPPPSDGLEDLLPHHS